MYLEFKLRKFYMKKVCKELIHKRNYSAERPAGHDF